MQLKQDHAEESATGSNLKKLLAGALHLVGGTAIGHTITLVATPVLAKLYGPDAFGFWAGWLGLAGVIGNVACLRYETAIALPKEDSEALSVAAAAISLAVMVCVASGLLLSVGWLLEIPGPWRQLGGHVFWVAPGALVIAWVGVATQWLARVHQVAGLAKAKIWSSGVTAGVQLVAGCFSGPAGLILGDIVGRGAGLWGRMTNIWREQSANIVAIRREHLRAALRRYRGHSTWMTPTALIDSLGAQAPLLLMLSWYGGTIGGQFSLAQRLMALPVALVGQSVAQLFLPAMAKAHRDSSNAAIRLYLGLSGLLALVGIVLIGFVWCLNENWVISLLGGEWEGLGGFLSPMSLLLAIQLWSSTVSQTAIILGGQKWYGLWVILWAAASIGGMWIGHAQAEANGAVWGLVIASGGLYAILWLVLLTSLFASQRRTLG
jgi:O-antigen/teichoic acid export membrane protein